MGNFKNGLMGFATADALGVPIEFTRRNLERPLKEMIGYGSHKVPEGTWSDDTSMLIATVDSINNKKDIDYVDIMKNFIKWYKNADYTATDELFDMGIATRSALHNFLTNPNQPTKCGVTGIRENGNGSLMRILPFVFWAYENGLNDDEVTELINNASSLTHAHEISRLGCKIYSDYIFGLLNGLSKEEALNNLQSIDYTKNYSLESLEYYKRILDGSIKDADVNEVSSSGFVVHTLEAAIWCTLKNANYEDAVVLAINLGDDTDTVGAVTGSLNGIIYGEENIPQRWTEKLRKKDMLEQLANKYEEVLNNKKNYTK